MIAENSLGLKSLRKGKCLWKFDKHALGAEGDQGLFGLDDYLSERSLGAGDLSQDSLAGIEVLKDLFHRISPANCHPDILPLI